MILSDKFVCEDRERSTYFKHVAAPIFRKSFTVPEHIKRAEISICGIGFYDLFVNGRKITKGYLAPYISNPDHITYYDLYDIKPYLQNGENVIGIMLGDGFGNSKTCVWDFDKNVFNASPKLACFAEIESFDKTEYYDASDFKCKKGAITFNDLRSGVFYDSRLEEKGLNIPIKHICNSAGIMMYPEMHLDMVRPGVILYGMYPSDEVDKSRLDLIPAMTLKSTITHIKEVEPGRGVSYGKEYITDKKTKIATVPIGYADGYLRKLAKHGKMIVDGVKVPIIGRICMDQCMIDVTNVHNIDKGDEVIIFGREGVTVDDLAEWLETINYEVSCVIGKRIPRIYTKDGKAVKVLNYLM